VTAATPPGDSPAEEEPRPVTDLDEHLSATLTAVHRARWIFLASLGAVLVAAVIILGVVVHQQQSALRASCHWWRVLAPVPVTIVPPARKPSVLSVTLIAGAREAYAGQRCGHLPPAAPSLRRWAAYYHVPVR
jgi:hypothetical protein